MSKNTIYDIAKKAKMRLIHKEYNGENQRTCNLSGISSYIITHKEVSKQPIKPKPSMSATEDALYSKVCEILESGEVSNPVSLLIDRSVFDSLDREGKQFYISNLTQKYKFLKDQYFRTHQGKFIV